MQPEELQGRSILASDRQEGNISLFTCLTRSELGGWRGTIYQGLSNLNQVQCLTMDLHCLEHSSNLMRQVLLVQICLPPVPIPHCETFVSLPKCDLFYRMFCLDQLE